MGEGPGAAAFALRELGLCDIKFAERREPGSANGALRVGAGSGLGRANAGGSLCFCESDSPGSASDNSPGPGLAGSRRPSRALPGCAGAGRLLPASPRLPPASAGLSLRPLPPSLPSEHTDESAGRQTAALRASLAGASPPGRGRGCRGWGRLVRGGLGPSGVNPCLWRRRLTLPPSLAPPALAPPINKKYQLFSSKEERCPQNATSRPLRRDPEAKWPILGSGRSSPKRASEASVPPWPPELAWVAV